MKTSHLLTLASLVAASTANGALYNLSDTDLYRGSGLIKTEVNQPTISSLNIPAAVINGALYARNADNSGSGTFRDIVRFDGDSGQDGGFEYGQRAYNRSTDNSLLQDSFIGQEDGVIRRSDMVQDASNNFFVFRLDINNEGFTSIDQLQIWQSPTDVTNVTGNTETNPNSIDDLKSALGVEPIYSLDESGGEDNTIFLNSDDTPGSGSSDLAIFIPQSLFGDEETDFIYFYAEMNSFDEGVDGLYEDVDGNTTVDISSKNGNHESFALPVIDDPDNPVYVVAIPEPGSATLLLLASALGMTRRRRA